MNTALVLGGTTPHIDLVCNLKQRGYKVVLIDYLQNPPAKSYADVHIKASTLDKEQVLNIAKEQDANLVISACIDQANSTCCWVAEQLGLPHPYSYETSLLVTDKGLMKQRMKQVGVPTSDFELTTDAKLVNWNKIVFPCVVKPVDCNSSKGVHRADSTSEAKKYIEEALQLSRTNHAIIERFVDGDEIQIDCLATKSDVSVVMTRRKMKFCSNDGAVLQSWGSQVPAGLTEEQQLEANEIAHKIATGFNLWNTPFFYQAILSSGHISVLEFAPRIGGGLSHYMLRAFVGFDGVDAVVNSYLHHSTNYERKSVMRIYRTCLLYVHPCMFDHIVGLDSLKANGIIDEFFITKSKGDVIDSDMRSSNRVGSFVVSGNTQEEIEGKIKYSYEHIEIIDNFGKNQLKLITKDIL